MVSQNEIIVENGPAVRNILSILRSYVIPFRETTEPYQLVPIY